MFSTHWNSSSLVTSWYWVYWVQSIILGRMVGCSTLQSSFRLRNSCFSLSEIGCSGSLSQNSIG